MKKLVKYFGLLFAMILCAGMLCVSVYAEDADDSPDWDEEYFTFEGNDSLVLYTAEYHMNGNDEETLVGNQTLITPTLIYAEEYKGTDSGTTFLQVTAPDTGCTTFNLNDMVSTDSPAGIESFTFISFGDIETVSGSEENVSVTSDGTLKIPAGTSGTMYVAASIPECSGYCGMSADQPEMQIEIRVKQSGEVQPVKGWVWNNSNCYYYKENGEKATGWQYIDGNWHYFDTDGAQLYGWQYIGGKWYYFGNKDDASGVMMTGWQTIDGNWYYLDANGAMVTGWQYIDDNWYYFNTNGARRQSDWIKANGKWYYMNWDGTMQTGWLNVEDGYHGWYYLDANGVMQTGWIKISNKWYYFDASGEMQIGWVKSGNNWYYMDESLSNTGAMMTGWQGLDGQYYFADNGAMLTGWQIIDGDWYYLKSSGGMVMGWQKIGNYWYYFIDDVEDVSQYGKMATGWKVIGKGTWYYFNSSGAMVTGWQQIGGAYYYFYSSGAMAKDTWIGDYYVNPYGIWTSSN